MKLPVRYRVEVECLDNKCPWKDVVLSAYTFNGNYNQDENIFKRIKKRMINLNTHDIHVNIYSTCNSTGKSFKNVAINLKDVSC